MADGTSHNAAAALSRLLGPLRRAVLRATRAAEGLPDLPDTHIEILRTVVDSPDISPKTIADRLGLARPTVSNLIQSMKRERLITLTRSDGDARVVHVTATDLATRLLNRYDAASEGLLVTALNQLARSDRSAIEAALPALSALHTILTAPKDSGGEV